MPDKKKKEDKFVLTDQPFVEFTVRAYRSKEDLGEGHRRGVMLMTFQDTCTDIIAMENGEKKECIGSVIGAIGGWMVQDCRRVFDDHYIIRPQEVWDAFQEALDNAGAPFAEMKEEYREQA